MSADKNADLIQMNNESALICVVSICAICGKDFATKPHQNTRTQRLILHEKLVYCDA